MSRYYVATMRLFPKSFTISGYEIIEAEDMIEGYTEEMEASWPSMEIHFSAPTYTPFVIADVIT